MKEGMFIVVEGIDGAGTSTQAVLLAEWFAACGLAAHRTWEPSGGRVGGLIREYLSGAVEVPDVDRHYHVLALLFAADRLDHLAREVEPRLREGIHVISDRYLLSSLAYQVLHCAPEWVAAINAEVRKPHLTFLLDLPVDIAMERLSRRSFFTATEIYETAEQLEKIRGLYLQAVRELAVDQEIVVIDGRPGPGDVHRAILAQLTPRLAVFQEKGKS